MRLCFLFNHDQIHQIAHSLPIALALAESGWPGEIIVATTNARLASEVLRLGGAAIGREIEHVTLGLTRRSQRLDHALGAILPAAKLLVYRDNLDFFRSLDVLVVAEKTSLLLKTRYGLTDLKIVHTRHGAGDRAIGFDKASAGFDHVLCAGPLLRDRLIRDAGVAAERITVVGYPKFDMPACEPLARPAGKPLVLYNPHASPHLSSWYAHGRAVLDFFVEHDEYELVCAPHLMLFERRFVVTIDRLAIDRPGRIEEKYLRAPNIRFDLGSRATTDMRYTTAADIYLGDVSSQVYEFLRRPRPCLFLNSHGIAWRDDPNFAQWTSGPVILTPRELELGLRATIERHDSEFRPIQQALFGERFDLNETPSSVRAAGAIQEFVGCKVPTTNALSRAARRPRYRPDGAASTFHDLCPDRTHQRSR